MADITEVALNVDLSQIEAWDGTKSFSDHPAGAFEGKTESAEFHTSKSSGKTSMHIVVATDAGRADLYLGLDLTNEVNAKKMVTALLSCGMKREALAKVKKIEPRLFLGREGKGAKCAIIVKEVEGVNEKGQKKLNDKEFLTPEQFAAYRAANGNAAPAPKAAAKGEGAPAGGGESVDDLFNS